VKAFCPVTISYSTAPKANISVRASAGLPSSCSGAINLYGPAYGLPKAISGIIITPTGCAANGDPPPQTLIIVGLSRDFLERNFESCELVGHIIAIATGSRMKRLQSIQTSLCAAGCAYPGPNSGSISDTTDDERLNAAVAQLFCGKMLTDVRNHSGVSGPQESRSVEL